MDPVLTAALELVIARTGHESYRAHLAKYPEKAAPVILGMAAAIREAEGLPVLESPSHLDEWTFVTTARLVRDTLTLAAMLPPDVDAVCAVARSGLLPGSLIATHYHLPLWTVSGGAGVTAPGHGGRMNGRAHAQPKHVLLIDDTAAMGREMRTCLPVVRSAFPGARVTRAVVYCHPRAVVDVEHFVWLYPGLHWLEWNVLNAGHGENVAVDFDGVLCRDFTPDECRDETTYRKVMAHIEPLYLPRRLPVKLIVTARPESARGITEAWLGRYGVRWEGLVMRDWDVSPAASFNEQVGLWKSVHYRRACCELFVESDPEQAQVIARETGKAVLCPLLERVIPPDPARRTELGDQPYGVKPRVPLGTRMKG